jgi:hypothetical protein
MKSMKIVRKMKTTGDGRDSFTEGVSKKKLRMR